MDREYINKCFEHLFDKPERKCERKICDIKRNITIPERYITENEHRFYVYGFYNPIWDGIFYIGKGTGSRMIISGLERTRYAFEHHLFAG